MAKLYTIDFRIQLSEKQVFSNKSTGWLLKDNQDHLLITTAHGICLDKTLDYTIKVKHNNNMLTVIGNIFKKPLFTNIIIMKIKDLSPELFIELTADNNNLEYFQLSHVSKNIYKENNNKLFLLAYDRLIKVEFIGPKINSIGHLPFAPKNILLSGKINEKIELSGFTGSPIISLNNDFSSRKIIGILEQHNIKTGEIKIIPSYYIWKSLIIDENIIQGINLPITFNKKWIFQKKINDIEKNDVLKKIDGYKLDKNGFIYDPSFGTKVPFDVYFLTKENKLINVEINRNDNIRHFTLSLYDINHLLPIEINNQTNFIKNENFIKFPINSGNLTFLKKSFNPNLSFFKKIFNDNDKIYSHISIENDKLKLL